MEVNGQLHAPAALPRGESPRYLLDRRRYGEEKNLTLAGNRNPAVQPVAIPTDLSQLLQ
jgi:hypothetical protein